MDDHDLDSARLADMERRLLSHRSTRVNRAQLWGYFAAAFPNRPPAEERAWLVHALDALQTRGIVTLPPPKGRRWDRSQMPPVPTSVDIVRPRRGPRAAAWKNHPWHHLLAWVPDLKVLPQKQEVFLRNLNAAIIDGTLQERVPRKYRSLQLTETEKGLDSYLKSGLFGPSRLTPALLNIEDEILPLACHVTGPGGNVLIFENAAPFHVARTVLSSLSQPAYDVVVFGGGNSIGQSMPYLTTLDRSIRRIEYVGDLDVEGRRMAALAHAAARNAGLPDVEPAGKLHALMLAQRHAFRRPDGWTHHANMTTRFRELLETVHRDQRIEVGNLLSRGRRIPEEVLGPAELRHLWQ